MKFTCSQPDLAKALNTVSKAVTQRTTLQILKGILITADADQKLTLSASDLELSIKTSIEANVTEKGSIVLPSKLINEIVRKLPHEDISFEEEKEKIKITCLQSEFNILGIPPKEFPEITDEKNGEIIEMDKNIIGEMIQKTSFTASLDETRGVLTGVLIEIRKNSIAMVALDGFRMAVTRKNVINDGERDVIIHRKILDEIGKVISEDENEDEKFSLVLDDKKAIFDLGRTKVVARLLSGNFIKYKDLIPKNQIISVLADKASFQESLERASIVLTEGKNNYIKISLNENRMTLTSRSEEGNAREEINVKKEGEDLDIGFNARYMTDVLKSIPDETIRMEFDAATSPCLIKPVEGDDFSYMILPVRLIAGR
jgi:DNA polymerase-3 subunit beta